MLTGTNLTYTKAYNFRIVFETIRLHGPISRADIARRTNLTAQTVSNIASRLLENQFIREGEKQQKKRGAPSTTLEVNPRGAYSVGLDFNRDHLTGIIVDLSGNVHSKFFYEIDSPSPEEAIDLMVSTINQLTDSEDVRNAHFCGVGIGLPGPLEINEKDEIINSINPKAFPGWNHVPIGKLLHEKIGSKIFIENNASAATIGERWYGAGKNISNFIYAFFGAGLGGGLVINGNLHEGMHRNAGEIGYMPYVSDISPLSDSDHPHVGEHFNLNRLYKWLNDDGLKTSRPEDLQKLFETGHPKFMEWLDSAKSYLTDVFLTFQYLLDIEVIILGGRLPKPIISEFANSIPIMMSEKSIDSRNLSSDFKCGTAGIDAAALGAATLPVFNLFAAQTDLLMKNSK